jgi:hypothetical membrane protein
MNRLSWKIIGTVAFLPHLIALIAATFLRPGFDHNRQYLSELGERGSSTERLMNYLGIIPTGAMIALFGIGLALQYRKERLALLAGLLILVHGLCRISAGLFPCDVSCIPDSPSVSQQIHNISASAGLISLTTAAFLMGAYFIVKSHGAHIIACSYAAGVIASIALFMLIHNPAKLAGLYQRIALGTLQLWITYMALYLLLSGRTPLTPE